MPKAGGCTQVKNPLFRCPSHVSSDLFFAFVAASPRPVDKHILVGPDGRLSLFESTTNIFCDADVAFELTADSYYDRLLSEEGLMTDFSALYKKHAPDVFRFALHLSGERGEAEDITSETFVRAWTSTEPIRMATVKGYPFAIARNLFLQGLKKKSRHTVLDENRRDPQVSPYAQAEQKAELRAVLQELQKLPEIDRAALLMRAFEEMPYEEIARALGENSYSGPIGQENEVAAVHHFSKEASCCFSANQIQGSAGLAGRGSSIELGMQVVGGHNSANEFVHCFGGQSFRQIRNGPKMDKLGKPSVSIVDSCVAATCPLFSQVSQLKQTGPGTNHYHYCSLKGVSGLSMTNRHVPSGGFRTTSALIPRCLSWGSVAVVRWTTHSPCSRAIPSRNSMTERVVRLI